MERKTISKKIRFEVFKRDSFKCQYCGRSAPDVILEVDHIMPVAAGGENNILNLVTSCADCNRGKSDRQLSDDSVVQKQKAQLEELQEKRDQIEMMLQWQRELAGLDDFSLDSAVEFWDNLTPDWHLSEDGKNDLKKCLQKYGLSETLESMRICQRQYLYDSRGAITPETIHKAFNYIPRVASARKLGQSKPYMKDLNYIRGILRNRGLYVGYDAIKYLEDAYKVGISIDDLKEIAIDANNWTEWLQTMEVVITAWSDNGQ